jgi:hypothetical protein
MQFFRVLDQDYIVFHGFLEFGKAVWKRARLVCVS